MSNSFEHFEKRFFCLLGRLRRHKGWMSEQSERNQSHGKSSLSKFFTIFAEINKYNKYENKIEYTD